MEKGVSLITFREIPFAVVNLMINFAAKERKRRMYFILMWILIIWIVIVVIGTLTGK